MRILRNLTTIYTMSLLAKDISFKKILKPGLIILISVFFSCDTQEDPGIQYELESNADVKLVEFVLPTSNVYIDSLRTDEENQILVGVKDDPITGSVRAESYFQLFYNFPNSNSTELT